MLAALAVAGFIAFVSGFVLRIGAFAVFALMSGVLYLGLLLHQDYAFFAALGLAVLLVVVMQVCYAIGVLLPSLIFRGASVRRRLPARQHSADPGDGNRGNRRPL